jgi:hypothetical protein
VHQVHIATYRVARVELGAFLANIGASVTLGRAPDAYFISNLLWKKALATSVMGANNTGPYTLPTDFNIGLVESSELSMYLLSTKPILKSVGRV